MRFLHTSDWQIGEPFRFVDDETLAILRAERLEVIARIGRLAIDSQAPIVLVAGDVFDGAHPSLDTLLRPIERMRQFPLVEWHLIPGNHDAHSANSPWERLLLQPLPGNVVVHIAPEPRSILVSRTA
jgi:DNA repair exonuclease SbcCD nuclease subunit